ncbi:hypothetical protein QQZ08_007928 [Neonectria magnoliae]|uniref:Heterokaryon incompatibility domain-containing protein n=1 Tax=Neonectria magnoliae TaxID=2732573 RepID=A0ABR1HWG5_9HYPO
MLCERCEGMHFHRISPGSSDSLYYVLHWTKESFLQSIAESCTFCVLISADLNVNKEPRPHYKEPGDTLDAFLVLRRSWAVDWVAKEGSAALFKSEPVDISSKIGDVYIDVIDTVPGKAYRPSHGIYLHYAERYRLDLIWPYPQKVIQSPGTPTGRKVPLDNVEPVGTCVYHSMIASDDSTGSMANFSLAKQWLTDCMANHPTCSVQPQHMNGSLLPIRLINVQDPHRPYLQLMTAGDQTVQYCALSYRWGAGKRLITTKANYSAFRALIPPKEMPRTFQDAIYASHMLNLQFVWIDALCIIQDDPDDVAREIAVMGGVYRNARLTLTAEGAASSSHGLFSRRNPRQTRPCVLPMCASAEDATVSGEVTVTASPRGTDYLNGRGWVLQEAVLSSRSLVFGTCSISWTCTSSFATESRPNPRLMNAVTSSLGPEIPKLRLWIYNRDLMLKKAPDRDYWHRLSHYDAWYRIVEDFTTRNLTVPTDSLPALAGLAQVFSESHQTIYLAGLWKGDLQVGLGWYLATDHGRPLQTNAPSAPTWSWVSVGQNRMLFRHWQANSVQITMAGAQVLDGICEPVNSLIPFGELKCGTLSLRAPLKRGMLKWDWQYYVKRPSNGSKSSGDRELRHYDHWGEQPRFPALVYDPETNKPVGEASLDTQFHPDLPAPGSFFWSGDHLRYGDLSFEMEVWCLLLQIREKYGNWHQTCLILTPTGSHEHEYKRIGLLFVGDTAWFGDYSRTWVGNEALTWKYKAEHYKWPPFLWLEEPATVTII